jgi:16S rRNA pseudouridine516 synthase
MSLRRIDQLLANLGYCSRREAREWIESGRVVVAGRTANDPGKKVAASDVRVDDEPLDHPDGLLLMMNKPLGLVCSHDTHEGPRIYDLLPPRWLKRNPAVTSIGRLDKDTSGLLLLTDQTPLVHRLTSPKHKVDKRYVATVNLPLKPELVSLFASGTLTLPDETNPCLPAQLRIVNPHTAEVILTEGRYHQVRRMFASQGYEVLTLHRAAFGAWELGDLAIGQWLEVALGVKVASSG